MKELAREVFDVGHIWICVISAEQVTNDRGRGRYLGRQAVKTLVCMLNGDTQGQSIELFTIFICVNL